MAKREKKDLSDFLDFIVPFDLISQLNTIETFNASAIVPVRKDLLVYYVVHLYQNINSIYYIPNCFFPEPIAMAAWFRT